MLAGVLAIAPVFKQLRQKEEAVQKSDEEYRNLFEHSLDLICTHDLTGKLLSINPEAVRSMGYEVKGMIGMSLQELAIPEFRGLVDEYLAEIRRNGVAQGILGVLSRLGEKQIWEYHNYLRVEGVKEPIVQGIARDITERWRAERALRKSEEKYRQLMETAQDYILSLDLTGKPT
jgi:PAS domain S-box-containing protein